MRCACSRMIPETIRCQTDFSPQHFAFCNMIYHLKFVLPKLLFSCLVQKWKIPDMVHKDVAEDRQIRVHGSDFAILGSKGSTEALEGSRRSKLRDLVGYLMGYELPF